jgi:hypothetical protein
MRAVMNAQREALMTVKHGTGGTNGHSRNGGNGRHTFTIVSKLGNWDAKATVRAQPRRMLCDEEAAGKLFFTPELVPAAQHPLVRALGPDAVRTLQVRHLYRYLDFTTRLELEVINNVARDIALDRAGPDLPDVMRADAFKLCTDESYHAYFSDDMRRQVSEATGITPQRTQTPPFLRRLRAITRALPRDQRRLSVALFAVVSETLISGILAQVPKDERVVTAVRALIADHAEDEGRHSAFFSQFFAYLWPRLGAELQAALGPLLPQFILAFLEPDSSAVRRDLTRLPLLPSEVETVVAQSYPATEVLSNACQAATVTLHLFAHQGLMDDPRIADSFCKHGLKD